MTTISVQDVHKSYPAGPRTVFALRGLSLDIAGPGFYGIMGQSGSGKSTLMHLLAALDRPDKGSVRVAGTALEGLNERAATEFRRSRVGIVFQQFNLIPTMTAADNVELPGMLAGKDRAWLNARSAELLGELGLWPTAGDHRPEALSGGEQQRVAIARALLFSPPLILADEPTGNLDSANRAAALAPARRHGRAETGDSWS
jgi:putative ABC transport system ATP-binding protein